MNADAAIDFIDTASVNFRVTVDPSRIMLEIVGGVLLITSWAWEVTEFVYPCSSV